MSDPIERIREGLRIVEIRATDESRWLVLIGDVRALLDRLDAAERENKSIRDILLRNGFVECDIPACNCGSWHHRYGLPERFHEIKGALADAGHELSNANGNTTLGALNELIEQRDATEAENERLRAERDEHARWREKLADDLHERESQIIDGWAALRDSGVQSEKNIADGIKLLRAENERLREFELSAALTLPGVYYMDPPDGGDVSLLKQLQRMSNDAARYRLLRRKFAIISDGEGNAEFCPINLPRPTYIAPSSAIELDTALDRERLGLEAIDAARAAERGKE